MPKTEVRSGQIKDATVGRSDVNTATAGEAVVAKIVAGTGISISSTGADTGTGDVTVTAAGGGAPAAHQTTHRSGGTDPVDVKLLAGYPGGTVNFLRGDGAFAAPTGVAPSLHKTTHQDGGGDELALDGSQITTGTVADARHSSNVPLKNTNNTFTAQQIMSTAQPMVTLIDTSQPADARNFWLWNGLQTLVVQAVSDSGGVVHGQVNISRTGVVTAAGLGTTPLNATNATSGTLPDARLSANIPKLNVANTFVSEQLFTFNSGSGTAGIKLDDPVVSGQHYRLILHESVFKVYGWNGTLLSVDYNGDVRALKGFWEAGRAAGMGHWVKSDLVPYAWGGYMTGNLWYTLIGKTMILKVFGTIQGGPHGYLRINSPMTLDWQTAGDMIPGVITATGGGGWVSTSYANLASQAVIDFYLAGAAQIPAGGGIFSYIDTSNCIGDNMAVEDSVKQMALTRDISTGGFMERVQAMLARVAGQVLIESGGTPYHQGRAIYAQRVVQNPQGAATQAGPQVVMGVNIVMTTTYDEETKMSTCTATDPELESQIVTCGILLVDWIHLHNGFALTRHYRQRTGDR